MIEAIKAFGGDLDSSVELNLHECDEKADHDHEHLDNIATPMMADPCMVSPPGMKETSLYPNLGLTPKDDLNPKGFKHKPTLKSKLSRLKHGKTFKNAEEYAAEHKEKTGETLIEEETLETQTNDLLAKVESEVG
jgi:hypothetical protein